MYSHDEDSSIVKFNLHENPAHRYFGPAKKRAIYSTGRNRMSCLFSREFSSYLFLKMSNLELLCNLHWRAAIGFKLICSTFSEWWFRLTASIKGKSQSMQCVLSRNFIIQTLHIISFQVVKSARWHQKRHRRVNKGVRVYGERYPAER